RWGVDTALHLVRSSEAPDRREWANLSPSERRAAVDRQRLAYLAEISVNWCPALGTVLANEEVDNDGRSDRGGHPVFRRPLRQWMLRITKYAERLLEDLDELVWPEPIKIMQRNWVGRSTGAEVVFPLADKWAIKDGQWTCLDDTVKLDGPLSYTNFPHSIPVYTTRPDTLFGATYMVVAPEHELVQQITTPEQREEVEGYIAAARRRSDLERTADTKKKTGVFTGGYALNPVNGQPVPVWVADYVLMGYGTGAIMAVPAHDTRDFEFAKAFDIPIITVVMPGDEWFREVAKIDGSAVWSDDPNKQQEVRDRLLSDPGAFDEPFIGEGTAVNSPGQCAAEDVPGGLCSFDGLSTAKAKAKITAWLEANGVGRAAVNYKLRDWIFSRQKYWGEPIPVLHGEDGETIVLTDEELPLELPPMDDFKPTPQASDDAESLPEPPLGRAKEWVTVERDGRRYRRDLNTMPQWAGSCWYYLRFIDPRNTAQFCGPEAEQYWMPIDLYVGGAEHAVLHLLYARFWHKVLFDLGHVSTREPFRKLFNQGMIQSFAYRSQRGLTVGPDKVEERGEDQYVLKETGEPVTRVIAKMSKALKNVVNPDEIIAEYGADTFRLYEMYMGPLDAAKPWNTRDVPGLFKLCQRIWRLIVDENTGALSPAITDDPPDEQAQRMLHKTIKRVTEELEQLKLNTAIAAIFDFVNFMTPLTKRPRRVIDPFVLVLSPFTPHLGEELWQRLGHEDSLVEEPWPKWDERVARDDEVEVAVQVSGKIKARIMVSSDADEETTRSAALADEMVAKAIEGKTIRKVIVVKGRLVNIVAN
ncbi:MAG: leucine--tRNA ligase, partial [Planctomycetes bacterium]|nr:leucine--tRNA ligase [Planctomycetota bacterium]